MINFLKARNPRISPRMGNTGGRGRKLPDDPTRVTDTSRKPTTARESTRVTDTSRESTGVTREPTGVTREYTGVTREYTGVTREPTGVRDTNIVTLLYATNELGRA